MQIRPRASLLELMDESATADLPFPLGIRDTGRGAPPTGPSVPNRLRPNPDLGIPCHAGCLLAAAPVRHQR